MNFLEGAGGLQHLVFRNGELIQKIIFEITKDLVDFCEAS